MYEEDARSFAVALYLDHGYSYEQIEFLLRDSRKYMGSRPSGGGGTSNGPVASTIREWVELFVQTGDVKPRDANALGNPVFSDAERVMLRGFVEADPTVMLDEVVYHMYYHTGKFVDISTMCSILHQLGFSHRQVRERMLRGPQFAAGHGQQEATFLAFQRRHHAREFVWFDETAAVERKLRRRFGWGAVGEELYTFVPAIVRRDVRWTLAATITVEGRELCAVVPGSLDRVGFLQFMEKVLRRMNRHWDIHGNRTYLPKSVLCLDNCSTHRCVEFYALARAAGVKVAFTPPYMPWYQPIENAFSVHKSVMRRYSTVLLGNPNVTAEDFILQSWELVGVGDPETWRNLARHAGYFVD